jgi:hypothetical protein
MCATRSPAAAPTHAGAAFSPTGAARESCSHGASWLDLELVAFSPTGAARSSGTSTAGESCSNGAPRLLELAATLGASAILGVFRRDSAEVRGIMAPPPAIGRYGRADGHGALLPASFPADFAAGITAGIAAGAAAPVAALFSPVADAFTPTASSASSTCSSLRASLRASGNGVPVPAVGCSVPATGASAHASADAPLHHRLDASWFEVVPNY